MNIEELEKKPHNEWTHDERVFWLQEYAKDEAIKEVIFDEIF